MSSLIAPIIVLFLYFKFSEGQNFAFSCLNQTQYCIAAGICRSCPLVRPYCDATRRECVANQPITQNNCPSRRDGAVPSLDDCFSYVQCFGGVGHRVLCPRGTVFQLSSSSCRRGVPCFRFVCMPWNEGSRVPYPGDPSLSAFCSGGRAVSLDSCGPGQQYVTGAGCQTFCPGEGNFPDYANCQGYYLCILTGFGTLQAIPVLCPPNQIFSPDLGQCVSTATADSNLRIQCSIDIN